MYENMITLFGSDGKIVVGYLGTAPSLYKVPMDKIIVNYAEKLEKFKEMEQKIRESDVAGGAIRRKEGIQMKLTIGEMGKRTVGWATDNLISRRDRKKWSIAEL